MSGRKSNLKQYQLVKNGDMSQASITSPVTNIANLDNIGIQLNFTGSPTGTFQIQISADYNQDYQGNVENPGNWVPMVFSTPPVASGSAGSVYLDIAELSAPWIRVVYVRASGSGSLQAWITGKMI